MSRRKINLLIVCEDLQQSTFARRYLIKRGFNQRKIRVKHNPSGRGAGEQFVRQQLIQEIKLHRRQRSYGKGGNTLIAMIDADKMSVQERLNQIDKELTSAGLESIKLDEKIGIFVPKRNIETWIEYADTLNIDETVAYPKSKKPSSCKHEIDSYINTICKTGLPPNAPSSLVHACDELDKIL
ncbi:MAG: hypothetical protein DRH37_07030 [Deltaproteobacteria bacterium]|nr:MAG: hypothetical protein DRH37_07030 [Deltaproteobacteria bacterium]